MSLQKKQSRVDSLRQRLAETEDLRRQLEAAERELAAAQRLRLSEPAPGSKVYITARYPGSSKVYEYLAIRIPEGGNQSWYITGREGVQTWDQIMSRIERADINVQTISFVNF